MTQFRIVLAATAGLVGALVSAGPAMAAESTDVPLVKYSYTGPPMTVITGVVAPWTKQSRITGYFIAPQLPPNYTTDFLDPDIEWPFPNLPPELSFTDGARTITKDQLEAVMKDTGKRIDPNQHEIRTFSFTTDAKGNITSWDVLFVHDVRRNTFMTTFNGGIHGQDLVEVDTSHFGCVATEKCTANANFAREGAALPDTQLPGVWTSELLTAAAGEGK